MPLNHFWAQRLEAERGGVHVDADDGLGRIKRLRRVTEGTMFVEEISEVLCADVESCQDARAGVGSSVETGRVAHGLAGAGGGRWVLE